MFGRLSQLLRLCVLMGLVFGMSSRTAGAAVSKIFARDVASTQIEKHSHSDSSLEDSFDLLEDAPIAPRLTLMQPVRPAVQVVVSSCDETFTLDPFVRMLERPPRV
ncbi:MAG: hypothetical protein JST16_09120 [Bdellovibrionales bacterium]|nr:hypothetical protein [Bdellovibrionales bacterium]